MPYYSDNWTDEQLAELEARIAEVYKQAEKDLDKEVKEYFAKFKLCDKEMQKLVEAGEMTKAEYQQWRMTQIGRGQRFEALRDKMAERYTKANEVANAYVNDMTPSIYSLNRNYEAYNIEHTVGSCDFTMWDESTVRRLLVEQPDLMPYYPAQRALDRGIDLAYGKSQITKHVTSGILRGLAPSKIASELMANMTSMERANAVRAARTGVTAAQNAGRFDSYVAAEKMGIKIKRRWINTKDSRTRKAHQGVKDVIGTKEPFDVDGEKMMFPGDTSLGASGWNIYNCRCSTRTVEKDGIEAEPRQMRVRDPVTGENVLVSEMSYSDWLKWKETGVKPEPQKLPEAKPKKEYLTEKKLKTKIADIDDQMAQMQAKYPNIDFTQGGTTDKHLKWNELQAQKDEYQSKLDAKVLAKQKKALVKKQKDIQQQIDDFEANLQMYTFPSASGKWSNVTAKDWEALKDELPKKIKYFEHKVIIGEGGISEMQKNAEYVKQLKKLDEDGKKLAGIKADLQKAKTEIANLGKKPNPKKANDVLGNALTFSDANDAVAYHEAKNFSRNIWNNIFTSDERDGIVAYTGNAYRAMNKHLRLGEHASDATLDYIKNCTTALNKTAIAEDVVVYRGMGSQRSVARLLGFTEKQLEAVVKTDVTQLIGTRVVEKGFTSTAITFGRAWSGCKLDIYLPAGTHAMYVDPISRFSGELELLLQRNSTFEIQNVEVVNGKITKMVLLLIDQS